MYQKIILILFLLGLPIYAQNKTKITISIYDRSNNSSVKSTQVFVQEMSRIYFTDSNGNIQIEVPNIGFYTFRIVLPDKVVVESKQVQYDGQKIRIGIGVPKKDSIVVIGEKENQKLSYYSLKQEEIKRLPGVSGDSLKAIQTLPGVSPTIPIGLTSSSFATLFTRSPFSPPYSNSEKGFLVMRGAGALANGYYLDGFPITYPYHLGNQSSVINNNLIQSFGINTGTYSTQYGFATGGIINIDTVSKVEKTYTVVNLNTFLSDAFHAQKLTDNSYFIASGRKSYPNFTLLKLYPQGIPEDAKFADYQDYQFKYHWNTEKHEILFLSFGARDFENYTKSVANIEEKSDSDLGTFGRRTQRPAVGIDRSFRTDGFRYTFRPTQRMNSTVKLSNNYFKEGFELDIKNPINAETILGLKNTTFINQFLAESINNVEIWKNYIKFQFGAQYKEKKIRLEAQNMRTGNSDFMRLFNNLIETDRSFRALIEGDNIRTRELAQFAELEINIFGLKLYPGVRTDYYDLSKEYKTSKRGRALYEIESTKTKFLAGYGEHYNTPYKLEQISTFSGNPNLKMEYSEHSSGGIEQELFSDYTLKVEGYRNIFKNLITPDSYISDPFSPNNNTRDWINKPDYMKQNLLFDRKLGYSNSRDGYSYGTEVFLKKSRGQEKTGWFGWLSYSNSITKRNNHKRRPDDNEETDRAKANKTRKLQYQTKVGTSYLNLYDNGEKEIIYDNDKEELYDLDRTHIFNIVGGWKFTPEWQLGGRISLMTNTPITPLINAKPQSLAGQRGINFYTTEYSKAYNSSRYSDFQQIDIRLDKFHNYEWGYVNSYIELINLIGRRNQIGETFNPFAPYSPYEAGRTIQNPKPNYYSYYVESKINGKVKYLPLISIGMEVRF